jgi:hypothetical protein
VLTARATPVVLAVLAAGVTVMPDLGVPPPVARRIADYLFSLR